MRFQISAVSLLIGAIAFHGSTAQQSVTTPSGGHDDFVTSDEVFTNPTSTDGMNSTEGEPASPSNTTADVDAEEVGSSVIYVTNSTENVTTVPSMSPSDMPSALPSVAPSSYPTIPSNAIYYDFPKLKWSTTLEGTGFFGDKEANIATGNAVLSSPDGVLVYVTLDNGALRVLSAHDGTTRWSYTPERLASGWSVTCNSGVYFGEMENGQQYVVYAVIDVPPDTGREDYSS
jgi:hypothetical protein